MKVMCINNSGAPELEIGNTYTASQCDEWDDGYVLAEMPVDPADNEPTAYFKWRFMPWESDETELIAEREAVGV